VKNPRKRVFQALQLTPCPFYKNDFDIPLTQIRALIVIGAAEVLCATKVTAPADVE
jgi:hypothetical protein